MNARRGESGLSGILLVDKPTGLTSHDVVNAVRRATGERRVGHAGTLDPMATGLLAVLVGPATRLAPFLSGNDKTYEARIIFGSATDTDDADGSLIRTAEVPPEVRDESAAQTLLDGLLGESMQIPPTYSAIKVGGQVAHRAARSGAALEVNPRRIAVYEATLKAIDPAASSWDVTFRVSKGTYIRALARDLGKRAGSAAHLGALRRTSSGRLEVADAVGLDRIASADNPADVASLFADPTCALEMPAIEVSEEEACRAGAGQSLDRDAHGDTDAADGSLVAIVREGALLAVYTGAGGVLKPHTVIPGGVKAGER